MITYSYFLEMDLKPVETNMTERLHLTHHLCSIRLVQKRTMWNKVIIILTYFCMVISVL